MPKYFNISISLVRRSVLHAVLIQLVVFLNSSQVRSCTSSQFECGDGICITLALKCDNTPDCRDFSDEQNCPTTSTCPEGGIRCPDNTCANTLTACPTHTTEETDSQNTENNNGCSNGCLIGIVFGVFVFLATVFLILFVLFLKKKICRHNRIEETDAPYQKDNLKNMQKAKLPPIATKEEIFQDRHDPMIPNRKLILPPIKRDKDR